MNHKEKDKVIEQLNLVTEDLEAEITSLRLAVIRLNTIIKGQNAAVVNRDELDARERDTQRRAFSFIKGQKSVIRRVVMADTEKLLELIGSIAQTPNRIG